MSVFKTRVFAHLSRRGLSAPGSKKARKTTLASEWVSKPGKSPCLTTFTDIQGGMATHPPLPQRWLKSEKIENFHPQRSQTTKTTSLMPLQKRVKNDYCSSFFVRFPARFRFFHFLIPGLRGPGNPFSHLLQSFLGRGLFDPCRKPTI